MDAKLRAPAGELFLALPTSLLSKTTRTPDCRLRQQFSTPAYRYWFVPYMDWFTGMGMVCAVPVPVPVLVCAALSRTPRTGTACTGTYAGKPLYLFLPDGDHAHPILCPKLNEPARIVSTWDLCHLFLAPSAKKPLRQASARTDQPWC